MGVIREKTTFTDQLNGDGSVARPAFARYFVRLVNRPEEEALTDALHLNRDRKYFTKSMLRSFLKNSVHRDSWTGAPWRVKETIANQYRIPTQVPRHLEYEHKIAERKQIHTLKRAEADGGTFNPFNPHNPHNQARLPELKPKSHKGKGPNPEMDRAKHQQFIAYQRALNPGFVASTPFSPHNDPQYIQFVNQHPSFPPIAAKSVSRRAPPPPQKFPTEDLEVPPVREAPTRPAMKFLSEDTPMAGRPSEGAGSGILMASVGPLLETWDTLNVYCEVFVLDSFTFDDYIEALQFTSEDAQCELLVEIHCAVLKKLVNDEKDLNGQVQINLPVANQHGTDTESSGPESTPTPEPEIPARTTRSSLAKSEAAGLKAAGAVDAKLHRAAEIDQCVKGYGWRFRLRKRNFANGKWVVIVVGLLNLFTANPRYRKTCDEILVKLAPLDMEPTEETAISQYAKLDINLRVRIVQFLCSLSLETQAIRGYMVDCTLQMTQHRKEKIEAQSNRKAAYVFQL